MEQSAKKFKTSNVNITSIKSLVDKVRQALDHFNKSFTVAHLQKLELGDKDATYNAIMKFVGFGNSFLASTMSNYVRSLLQKLSKEWDQGQDKLNALPDPTEDRTGFLKALKQHGTVPADYHKKSEDLSSLITVIRSTCTGWELEENDDLKWDEALVNAEDVAGECECVIMLSALLATLSLPDTRKPAGTDQRAMLLQCYGALVNTDKVTRTPKFAPACFVEEARVILESFDVNYPGRAGGSFVF